MQIISHPFVSGLPNNVNALLSQDSQADEYDSIVPLQPWKEVARLLRSSWCWRGSRYR